MGKPESGHPQKEAFVAHYAARARVIAYVNVGRFNGDLDVTGQFCMREAMIVARHATFAQNGPKLGLSDEEHRFRMTQARSGAVELAGRLLALAADVGMAEVRLAGEEGGKDAGPGTQTE